MNDLFADQEAPWQEPLVPGALVLRGFARAHANTILAAVQAVTAEAPFRHMLTPGGLPMSVAMSNCGALGWITDRQGYRYSPVDPHSSQPWPPIPASLLHFARQAAAEAGFADFTPDACLINRYAPGTRMSLHQDRDERDFTRPIVSVSLGLPIVFLFGGMERKDKAARIPLSHGDVVVWGGPARLRFHGVLPLKDGHHPATGNCRINLTFRKAG